MQSKPTESVNVCTDCKTFGDKKTMEPSFYQGPSKNWEIVAVDLSGPMPLSNYIIVVQGLSSRYPAPKLQPWIKYLGKTIVFM